MPVTVDSGGWSACSARRERAGTSSPDVASTDPAAIDANAIADSGEAVKHMNPH